MSWSDGACSYSQALKGSRHASPNGDTDETSLHALAIEPRCDTSTCERRQVEQHLPVLDIPQRRSWSEPGSVSPGFETYSQNLEALKGERYVPLHGDTDESSLHPLAIEPRHDTGVHEIRKQAVRHPQTPDFYDLQRQLSVDGSCHGTSATWSSSETGSEKSKCAAQIGKIVKMVKRKLPEWEEQEIYRRVVDLRKAEGGFSYMTLNAIVARVLSHIRDTVHDSAVRPTS
ncbi:hypothetical protein MTO96_015245 [Rhipicephalus appendiculatus]